MKFGQNKGILGETLKLYFRTNPRFG